MYRWLSWLRSLSFNVILSSSVNGVIGFHYLITLKGKFPQRPTPKPCKSHLQLPHCQHCCLHGVVVITPNYLPGEKLKITWDKKLTLTYWLPFLFLSPTTPLSVYLKCAPDLSFDFCCEENITLQRKKHWGKLTWLGNELSCDTEISTGCPKSLPNVTKFIKYVLWTFLACYKGGSTHQDENTKVKIVQPFFAIKEKQSPYPIILTPTPLPQLPTPAPGSKCSLTRKWPCKK